MVKQWKLNAHSDKARKDILNVMHVQIKKQSQAIISVPRAHTSSWRLMP